MILLWLMALRPADLAPGAPELQEAELKLSNLVRTAQAVGAATSRLQVAWTNFPTTSTCEDAARLEIGWRIERFGAAWRESVQAARAASARLAEVRTAPTVTPLLSVEWSARLDALTLAVDTQERSFLEASAWQLRLVRPALAACPIPPLQPAAGIPMPTVAVRGEPSLPVAVLTTEQGGYVCPGARPAEGAVILLADGRGCWAPDVGCGCDLADVEPGAVLGAPSTKDEAE